MRKSLGLLFALVALSASAYYASLTGPGSSFYATDAYPGFDDLDAQLEKERKEPKWFSWWNGPEEDNAKEQLAYCQKLIAEDDSDAIDELDALVREWPTSPEAPEAQRRLADLLMLDGEYEEAYEAYRYLLDFYPLQCDYNTVSDKLYELAQKLREVGKRTLFIRFDNTVDVRRYFEGAVLRAPGAKWAPKALLTIGDLRIEEEAYENALKVYENLRNLHYKSPEAKMAISREAEVRMQLIDDFGYNRERVADTVKFLEMAVREANEVDRGMLREYLSKLNRHLEDEEYRSAKFYDSRMRTKRSAINAYRRYLENYPDGEHADEVRSRLEELKGEMK